MALDPIDVAFRRYRILKELIRREREYTRGYVDLRRLYDIGVLEKGMPGEARTIAQETLDSLDNFIDALGFLDITASFEAVALHHIRGILVQTVATLRDRVNRAELAPAAPGLLREIDEFSMSLRRVLVLLRSASDPDDVEKLEAINDTRNDIAHGRVPAGFPVAHEELASLLSRLIDRQLLY